MLLTSANVADYLLAQELCQSYTDKLKIKPIAAKNFNLLVTFENNQQLLVKQERHNQEGKTANEFQQESKIQDLIATFSELDDLRDFLPIILHYDQDNSIIVFRYLNEYFDLAEFYTKENSFPLSVASSIGQTIATIHRRTFKYQKYQDFFTVDNTPNNQVQNLGERLEKITPEIFSLVPADGLKFFALYQRYDSLGKAIAELGDAFTPSCLVHNDLKLNNILLHNNWSSPEQNIVRLIDWERSGWGDPAFDLGTLIASYVQIWLSSLVISSSLRIDESLKLATTPLEILQPSIANLTISYLKTFPEIIEQRPDFLLRTVQNAGFVLIMNIQAMIQYQKSFGNMGIGMLQVAKSLLCRPKQSMPTLFGTHTSQISQVQNSAV